MAGSASARMGRIGRQIVAVMVLSLVLGGVATSPASANQRGPAVNEANNVISACFKADGNPWHVVAGDRHINVLCEYADGTLNCHWWADDGWKPDCYWTPNPAVPNPDGGASLDPGDAILQGRTAAFAPGTLSALTADERDGGDDQDTDKHHQKKAKGKGKHHSKAKGHSKGGKRK